MIIISNTTPLNYLILIDGVDILHELYGEITIPEIVFGELQREKTPEKVRQWIKQHPAWLIIRNVEVAVDENLEKLQVGERAAIVLAENLQADAVILDDGAAREEAHRRGLRVIGTLRVLYDAAESGLCNLAEVFHRLQQTSFRASQTLYQRFLDQAAEKKTE